MSHYYRYFRDLPDYSGNEHRPSILGEHAKCPQYDRYCEYVGGYYGNGEYEIKLSELDELIDTPTYPAIVIDGPASIKSGATMYPAVVQGSHQSIFGHSGHHAEPSASTLDKKLVNLFKDIDHMDDQHVAPAAISPRGRYEVDDEYQSDNETISHETIITGESDEILPQCPVVDDPTNYESDTNCTYINDDNEDNDIDMNSTEVAGLFSN